MYQGVAANNFLYAVTNTNPPTNLNGRPRNNNFMVQILSGVDTAYNVVPASYQLILSFEELKLI